MVTSQVNSAESAVTLPPAGRWDAAQGRAHPLRAKTSILTGERVLNFSAACANRTCRRRLDTTELDGRRTTMADDRG
jgi:hypothetical protein